MKKGVTETLYSMDMKYKSLFYIWFPVSDFSDAVRKHCGKGKLQKEEFMWAQGSRGIRIYYV